MNLKSNILYRFLFIYPLLGLVVACAEEKPDVGEKIVSSVCVACHMQGINGAPIIGNEKMWSKRLPQGETVLIDHAINGYELMPAKGGRPELSDEEIAAAVRFMVSKIK